MPSARGWEVRLVLVTLACALLLSLAFALVRDALPAASAQAQLMAVLAPDRAAAHDRFVIYAGIDAEAPARLRVRVCQAQRCPVDRTQALEAGTTWTWIAAAELPPGSYEVTVLVQTRQAFGFRTVALHRSSLEVA